MSLVPVQIRSRYHNLVYDAETNYTLAPSQQWIACCKDSQFKLWSIKRENFAHHLDNVISHTWLCHKTDQGSEDLFACVTQNGDLFFYLIANERNPSGNFLDVIWRDDLTQIVKYSINELRATSILYCEKNQILAITEDNVVQKLLAVNDWITLENHFTLPVKYLSLDATENYLFGLSENVVDVYDLEDGTHVGRIDISLLDSTTKIFTLMHVSRDALQISVLDSYNSIFVVEVDKFFQPVVKIEEPKTEEDEYAESESGDEGTLKFKII
jgi:hypothetical protein